MSCSSVQDFSDFMQDLADIAERATPADFRSLALGALQCRIGFKAAIWGTAAIGEGLSFREVAILGLPQTAVAEVEAGASADPRLPVVLSSPGTSYAYSVSGDDPEIMRVQMARYGLAHILSTAFFDAGLGLASGIVLMGSANREAFDEAERAFMEAAFPHLLRGWSANQIKALTREIAASNGMPRHAAAIRHGVVAAAEEEFLLLFRQEWPGWHGPVLPADVCALLALADGGRHVGAVVVLTLRHGHDVSLMLIRERVAADDLRPRERAVAELCATGFTYREIADALGMAPATARNHIASVHRRLGVSRNSEISALLAAAT